MFLRRVLSFFVFPWMFYFWSTCACWLLRLGTRARQPLHSEWTSLHIRVVCFLKVSRQKSTERLRVLDFLYYSLLLARFCPDCWTYSLKGFRCFCTKLTSWFACVLVDGLGHTSLGLSSQDILTQLLFVWPPVPSTSFTHSGLYQDGR